MRNLIYHARAIMDMQRLVSDVEPLYIHMIVALVTLVTVYKVPNKAIGAYRQVLQAVLLGKDSSMGHVFNVPLDKSHPMATLPAHVHHAKRVKNPHLLQVKAAPIVQKGHFKMKQERRHVLHVPLEHLLITSAAVHAHRTQLPATLGNTKRLPGQPQVTESVPKMCASVQVGQLQPAHNVPNMMQTCAHHARQDTSWWVISALNAQPDIRACRVLPLVICALLDTA